MIGIIDYGIGNLRNVSLGFDRLGADNFISSDIKKLSSSKALILPGVGAFGDGIEEINNSDIREFLDTWVKSGNFLLGICLGMQLLFEKSYEMGEYDGLGYISGDIKEIKCPYKVPHMGWNKLVKNQNDPIINGIKEEDYVYFVHSYYGCNMKDENLISYCDYGVKIPAIVKKDNVYGMQFHPEKSSDVGGKLLSNFMEMIK